MSEITVPNDWRTRPYQDALWSFLANGGKRAAIKWHRRSGKDSTALHWATEAATRRVGVYWHMLPTLRQARKVIWENVVEDEFGVGHPVLDAWPGWSRPGKPGSLVKSIRNDEMKIELVNGSIWYAVGSDNYDAVMGTNPVGIVLSEWALSDPKAWDYIRPILTENGGWAVFIWTPRGKNHASRLYRMAEKQPAWFTQTLTVDDTRRVDGRPVVTAEAIQAERDEGASEEHLLQEYWCSEDAPMVGAFWGEQLITALREKRICHVPHDPAIKVDVWYDLGHSDAFAMWFVQHVAGEIHLIDYHEDNNKTLAHYAAVLQAKQQEREMVYGRHIWPLDGGARTLASKGRRLSEMFHDVGFSAEVQPKQDPMVGIQRVRQILPRCWFDEHRCEKGLDALRAYRKVLDEEHSTEARPHFKPKPLHDWSSHGATAFTVGALVVVTGMSSRVKPPPRARYMPKPERPSAWSA